MILPFQKSTHLNLYKGKTTASCRSSCLEYMSIELVLDSNPNFVWFSLMLFFKLNNYCFYLTQTCTVQQEGNLWIKAHQIVSHVNILWCDVRFVFWQNASVFKNSENKSKFKEGNFSVLERVNITQFQFLPLNDNLNLTLAFEIANPLCLHMSSILICYEMSQ